jgi:DNA repair exonuclease SbcCD ATPase subunit
MNTDRISQMEQRLERTSAAVEALEAALEQYQAVRDDLASLDTYLGSPEWHADRNDDEAGRLPADLRRGVLSEDAIWNLLERNRELHKQIQEL